MDIGLLQMMAAPPSNQIAKGQPNMQGNENSFGTILGGVLSSTQGSMVETPSTNQLQEISIGSILQASSIEELAKELNISPEQLQEEIEQMLNGQGTGVLTTLENLLEKLGIPLEDADEGLAFWTILSQIEAHAPAIFKELKDSLEGKGALSQQEAVELATLLKSISIAVPERDLLMKQEQQIFTLQNFLSATNVKLEGLTVRATNVFQQLQPVEQTVVVANSQNNQQSFSESKEQPTQVFSIHANPAMVRNDAQVTNPEQNQARGEALMREMQTIFKRANFGQVGGTNRLLIKLYPEHLGQVRIELLQTNGVLTARILASSALGKEMLDSQLHQLRAAFTQQGLQVERIDITQTLQDTTRQEREQAFNQHFRKESEEQEESTDDDSEEEMSFQEYMIELEV